MADLRVGQPTPEVRPAGYRSLHTLDDPMPTHVDPLQVVRCMLSRLHATLSAEGGSSSMAQSNQRQPLTEVSNNGATGQAGECMSSKKARRRQQCVFSWA